MTSYDHDGIRRAIFFADRVEAGQSSFFFFFFSFVDASAYGGSTDRFDMHAIYVQSTEERQAMESIVGENKEENPPDNARRTKNIISCSTRLSAQGVSGTSSMTRRPDDARRTVEASAILRTKASQWRCISGVHSGWIDSPQCSPCDLTYCASLYWRGCVRRAFFNVQMGTSPTRTQ